MYKKAYRIIQQVVCKVTVRMRLKWLIIVGMWGEAWQRSEDQCVLKACMNYSASSSSEDFFLANGIDMGVLPSAVASQWIHFTWVVLSVQRVGSALCARCQWSELLTMTVCQCPSTPFSVHVSSTRPEWLSQTPNTQLCAHAKPPLRCHMHLSSLPRSPCLTSKVYPIRRVLDSHNNKVCFHPHQTLRYLLARPKDLVPQEARRGIV